MEKYVAFAAETVAPIVKGLESHSVCLKDFMQNLGQKGYLGIAVPREYGDQGNPFTFCALFVEAVSKFRTRAGAKPCQSLCLNRSSEEIWDRYTEVALSAAFESRRTAWHSCVL